MDILVVASNLSAVGGIQAYNRTLISALRREGERVRTIELSTTAVVSKVRFVLGFFRAAIFERPDLILVTNINFSPLAYTAKLLLRIPYTVTIYGIEVARVQSVIQKKALSQALLVVKLFNQAERDITRQLPSLRGKMVTIPNSVDDKKFVVFKEKPREFLRKYQFMNAKLVLTVCRLSASERDNKGYAKVIEAFPEVLKKVPDARYILVGDGDDRVATEVLVKRLNLEEKVLLPGAVKDEEMAGYYNLADVFVYVSKREGFPAIVLLEALACGTPVVCGDQPDAIGSSFDGTLGFVVNPDDRVALADAIVKVLSGSAPKHFYVREELRQKVLAEYGYNVYRRHVTAFLSRARHELGI